MKTDRQTPEPGTPGLYEKIGRHISARLSQYSSRFTRQFRITMVILGVLFAFFCLSLIISSWTGTTPTPPFLIQRITQPPVSKKDSARNEQAKILRRLMEKLEKTPRPNSLFDSLPSAKTDNEGNPDTTTGRNPDFLH